MNGIMVNTGLKSAIHWLIIVPSLIGGYVSVIILFPQKEVPVNEVSLYIAVADLVVYYAITLILFIIGVMLGEDIMPKGALRTLTCLNLILLGAFWLAAWMHYYHGWYYVPTLIVAAGGMFWVLRIVKDNL